MLLLSAGNQGKVEDDPGEEVMEQQSDMETVELQSLMTDHPAVVLTLLVLSSPPHCHGVQYLSD